MDDESDCAQILLDNGADIEARDENDCTALWDAMEPQNGLVSGPAVARLLVERGADISTGFMLDLYHEGEERFGRFDIIDELVRLCEASF